MPSRVRMIVTNIQIEEMSLKTKEISGKTALFRKWNCQSKYPDRFPLNSYMHLAIILFARNCTNHNICPTISYLVGSLFVLSSWLA